MPIPFALLASLAPGIAQVGSGILQDRKANQVRLQDTRPASFPEELSLRRQAANSQQFAGQGQAVARINQQAANSTAALTQSGTGASGILAGITRVNQNTNAANQNLAAQAQASQQQATNQLAGALRQDAAYRQQDQNNFNRERAALKQSSAQNLFGGLSTLGSVGAYAAGGGFKNDSAGFSPMVNAMNAAGQAMPQQPAGWQPSPLMPGQQPNLFQQFGAYGRRFGQMF